MSSAGGEGYRVTAQMVLVCCWRSMKEVAMLLGQLCQSLPLHHTNESGHTHPGLITEEQVRPPHAELHQLCTRWRWTNTEFWYLNFKESQIHPSYQRSLLVQVLPEQQELTRSDQQRAAHPHMKSLLTSHWLLTSESFVKMLKPTLWLKNWTNHLVT